MFIVSISLLRKILNACQNEIHGIVACTLINVCEKNHQFLSSIKQEAQLSPRDRAMRRVS